MRVRECACVRVRALAGNAIQCTRARQQLLALTGLTGGRSLRPAGRTDELTGRQLEQSRGHDLVNTIAEAD